MNKKERTIKACKELINKYRNPIGKEFFYSNSCPLCDIHYKKHKFTIYPCKGCPLAAKHGFIGCFDFKTFIIAENKYDSNNLYNSNNLTETTLKAFEDRAKFFEKIIPILEKYPNKRFTKNGWKYTEEINRDW